MRQIQHDKEQGTQNKEATSLSPSSVPVASFVLHAQFLVVLSFDLGVDLVRRTSRVGPWARIAENDEQEKSTWPVVLGVGSFVVLRSSTNRTVDNRTDGYFMFRVLPISIGLGGKGTAHRKPPEVCGLSAAPPPPTNTAT